MQFAIFFGTVILVYFLVNYYIYVHGLMAFQSTGNFKSIYKVLFWVIASTFIVGEILEHTHSSLAGEWVYRIGAFWLSFMLYLFIATLFIDIIRLLDKFFHIVPSVLKSNPENLGLWTGITVFSLVAIVVFFGHLNALHTRVKQISISLPKNVSGAPDMKILMASDIHLGALIGERREQKLVDIINQQQPDLVLLCGDMVDGDIAPVLRKKLGRHLQETKPPMGMYAIPGNHEYIGGITETLPYLESININVLRDQIVTLPNGVQIVGRDDLSARNRDGGRKELPGLLENVDMNSPVIVMNHQPFNLEEVAKAGVDLHLSGHTHDGQMWPLNYITEAIFEDSWGFLKKDKTNIYVSSGFGSWGPPVRIGNSPEVVVFNLHFNRKQQNYRHD
jgi:hypothetical protein